MKAKSKFLTEVLAVIGTVLVWLPLLAPLFFGLIAAGAEGVFRFDYLMPAELSLLVLVGGGLLVWAAARFHSRIVFIGVALGIATGALISAQLTAMVTGLASGEILPGGWQWMLVITLLAIYATAVAVIGVGGLLLLRDIFKLDPANFKR